MARIESLVAKSPPVSSVSYAATITIDAGAVADIVNIAAAGDATINAPTGGVDRQILRIAVSAGAAGRTVTVASAIRLSTGLASRTFTVGADEVLLVALEYVSVVSAWVLTAATVSAA